MTAAAVVGQGGLLTGLLPEDVEVRELFADPPDVGLFPQEAEVVAGAVAARRREFATVRRCARGALARLGVAPGPIVPAREGPPWAHRAPRWPNGVVGSMTHCEGYRGAAVAWRTAVASVGVDAEPNVPVPHGLLDVVALPEERGVLDRLTTADPAIAWDRLLFSAKESVFKAWFPLTGRWLDFSECVIVPDPDLGTFTATLKVPGPLVSGVRVDRFDGRWRRLATEGPGHLATAVVVRVPCPES
ncbi:4'-phosphopantetheinyl transferase superfamily protein [Streptomyces sp. H27-C3]|uniref:4'-phosphopantetheinyl transferase family protein n=1 Tax=Streptomyces sp. H27-C3 TaxID=3046305 RepID=UPI0024B9BAA2|nr:4'-phosphopantetheinyl transferase superfamily protein [Streptomyces sp. H27-C3]MDJ0460318.1 4'-phosphopantetheinyl transferase superfamily protein [Streptomyces sp. H27-C3]